MKITGIIDRDVFFVSILEDTRDLAEWLIQRRYYGIVDEELRIVGIITAADLTNGSIRSVIDCDFIKPEISPEQSPQEVFEVLKSSKNHFLPVFFNRDFIGVISLYAIEKKLADVLK